MPRKLCLSKPMLTAPRLTPALICLTLLSGCDLQLWSDSEDDEQATGSDGGASIGVLTDASSLIVNYDSDYTFSSSADITLDGEDIDSSDLEDGMVVNLTFAESDSNTLTSGTVTSLTARHLIKGPVTNLSPLEVLGNQVTVTDDTEMDGIDDDDINNLALGTDVRISGYTNRLGGILATRIDVPTGGNASWKLTGNVESLTPNDNFFINGQQVLLNGVIADCDDGLTEGDFVEVSASPNSDFIDGDSVETTLAVTCIDNALAQLSNNDVDIDQLPAEMEGFVSSIDSIVELSIDEQPIELASSVSYQGGNARDLIVGARVEFEGSVDLDTGVLTATRIKFHQRPIFIEAPLASTDITINESVNFFGLDITTNNLVVDDDLIVSSGIADQQVRLYGFVDEEQNPYAITLVLRGAIDDEDVTLQGPVSRVSSSSFDVMGISVDGSAAAAIANSLDEEDMVLIENAEVDGDTGITNGTISQL